MSYPLFDDPDALQRLVDSQFRNQRHITQMSFLVAAEAMELDADLLEVIRCVPAGTYPRGRFCDQLNSSIVGHGWTQRYHTVD